MLRLRTQSFRRYRIAGEVPSPFQDAFHERLAERAFQPLGASEERTYGWVTADNCLVTDFHVGTVVRGVWAAIGIRIDRRRVNARLLRAHLDLEVEAHRKASLDGGGAGRIRREERKTLREDIHQRLLGETSPSVDVVNLLVHTKQRVAHVLALSRGANEVARVLFLDTFGAELVPLTPWRRSLELLEGSALAPRLAELERTDFGALRAPAAAPRGGVEVPVEVARTSEEATT